MNRENQITCDFCGATIPKDKAVPTGSFGFSGFMCRDSKDCPLERLLIPEGKSNQQEKAP